MLQRFAVQFSFNVAPSLQRKQRYGFHFLSLIQGTVASKRAKTASKSTKNNVKVRENRKYQKDEKKLRTLVSVCI